MILLFSRFLGFRLSRFCPAPHAPKIPARLAPTTALPSRTRHMLDRQRVLACRGRLRGKSLATPRNVHKTHPVPYPIFHCHRIYLFPVSYLSPVPRFHFGFWSDYCSVPLTEIVLWKAMSSVIPTTMMLHASSSDIGFVRRIDRHVCMISCSVTLSKRSSASMFTFSIGFIFL